MGLKNGNLKTLLTIGGVLVAITTSWVVMQATVDSVDILAHENKDEIKKKVDQEEFDELKGQVRETHESVIRLEEQVGAANKNQDKMDKKLDRILDKLNED